MAYVVNKTSDALSITGNGTTYVYFNHPSRQSGLLLVSTVSSRTDGTYTVTLQHKVNGQWLDVVDTGGNALTTGAQSANGTAQKVFGREIDAASECRFEIVAGSVTTGATVQVELLSSAKY